MNVDLEATKGSAALYAWFVWEKGWESVTIKKQECDVLSMPFASKTMTNS
ncbi:MAG: hypothetical protein II951_00730 [Bacteroidales bacterium]|nr:hypothetical protein [Bacteroidales bacterium]